MGKKENLYVSEFVEYYFNLGFDHLFIYDDNDPNDEKISNAIGSKYKDNITIYENIKKNNINRKDEAFNDCYIKNPNEYDWFAMFDMDEYLYIVDGNIKDYLTNNIFDKSDFIRNHWVSTNDNNLVHYENRSLFDRFKAPYFKDNTIKSIIRGNITDLKYWMHSPMISPKRNVSYLNNEEKFDREFKSEGNKNINVDKAFTVHFRYRSTEEFFAKYKRGYSNWFKDGIKSFLDRRLDEYFEQKKLQQKK